MVHTHQSAVVWPVCPVALSVQSTVTPVQSCAILPTRVFSRTMLPTWRMKPAWPNGT